MPTERTHIGCPICARHYPPVKLGLTASGAFDPSIHSPLLKTYRLTFGGRGRLAVEHLPLSLPFAYGLRDALRTALARLEQEIVDAGGELTE